MRHSLPALAFLIACGATEPEKPACTLSLDTLDGSMWVMDDPQADGTSKPNLQARMKFRTEDGQLKLDYTVKDPLNTYVFDCTTKGEGDDAELECFEAPRVADWCMALEAFDEGTCTPPALRDFGISDAVSKGDLLAEIKKAKAQVKAWKKDGQWDRQKLVRNNVGNPLQGRVYVAVNSRTCTLKITDNYMTIYNGEQREDSNPVGTNPFVAYEGGELLFESCGPGRIVADLEVEELPETIPAPAPHEFGAQIWYHYLGKDLVKPEEGCTYSMDTYAQWKALEAGVDVPVVDGKVVWKASHTFGDADKDALHQLNPVGPIGLFSMVRHKECAGKKEKVDTVCGVANYIADPSFMPVAKE